MQLIPYLNATGIPVPIMFTRYDGDPYSALIDSQNQCFIDQFGDYAGHSLNDFLCQAMASESKPGEYLIHQLMSSGKLDGIQGTINNKRVEIFASLSAAGLIQFVIFDVTSRMLDKMTGIPGRELFFNRIDSAISMARRENSELIVMFIDLDGFKHVNDTHGHAAGDSVLKITALRIAACVRSHETVSRIGGDEFGVILSGREIDPIHVAESKILPAINEPISLDSGQIVRIGASIGISRFPGISIDSDGLVSAADKAMYVAKRNGKNRAVCINP